MTENVRVLAEGAFGRFIQSDRFNTTLMTFHFYSPLDSARMTEDALLPYLLTSCSDEYKSFTELNKKLLALYGAELSCSVAKTGDYFHTRIGISVINNSFAFDGEDAVGEAAELLLSLIFAPAIEEGAFLPCDLDREKRKTLERIESEINNKRSFARSQLLSLMLPDDPYGKFIYGTAEEVERITGEDMARAWERFITESAIQFNVVAQNCPEAIFEMVADRLSQFDRSGVVEIKASKRITDAKEVKDLTAEMDVTQGKLVMGFTSELYGSMREALPLVIFSDIFGGGPYSYLFENVREKMSLCYYCSSSQRRAKGLLIVDSGVEKENAERAFNAIMAELAGMQKGEIDPDKLTVSKRSVIDSIASYYDSAAALDNWYSANLLDDDSLSVEEVISLINKITLDDLVKAAGGIKLHTVYRLLPKEAR